jgi:hypothetical protein
MDMNDNVLTWELNLYCWKQKNFIDEDREYNKWVKVPSPWELSLEHKIAAPEEQPVYRNYSLNDFGSRGAS